MPEIATSKWWKEERGIRVFIDYNQNARDHTVASAYSVRPVPNARVSAPFTWVCSSAESGHQIRFNPDTQYGWIRTLNTDQSGQADG
jgi:DNA primase